MQIRPMTRAAMKRSYERGLSVSDLTRRTGRSEYRVTRLLDEVGTQMRPGGAVGYKHKTASKREGLVACYAAVREMRRIADAIEARLDEIRLHNK